MKPIQTISLVLIYVVIIVISLLIQGRFTSNENKVDIDVKIPEANEIQEVVQKEGVDKKTDINHAKLIILNKDYIKPVELNKININQL